MWGKVTRLLNKTGSSEGAQAEDVSVFDSIDDLRQRLRQVEAGTDDQKRQTWPGMRLSDSLRRDLAQPFTSLDPFAPNYKACVLEAFNHLHDSEYSLMREGMKGIDLEQNLRMPFPYALRNPQLIGQFVSSYGHIITRIGERFPQPGRRIRVLELGSGRGALSWFLARASFDLTCVDINPEFSVLCGRMTEAAGNKARCVTAAMEDFSDDPVYDVVLFFESFHHSLHHTEVLDRAVKMLAPGGIVMFGAEPITPDDALQVPYPWGLRLGMEALRGIILFGWLELGFRRSYFVDMLHRAGLQHVEFGLPGVNWSHLFIASRG